jgi:GMP synthase-like glutamine amidotransferase
VSYLQALAVPLLGAIIALLGAWIAARQMLIAHEKLQIDAFDRQYERRVAVYEATRQFLADVFHGNISNDAIQAYGLRTLDAKFLFDDNLFKYLREVLQHVTGWHSATHSMRNLRPGAEQDAYNEIASAHLKWIIEQGDEVTGFDTRFTPFLLHRQARRPWLLRWP